jgi:hypothetical protein
LDKQVGLKRKLWYNWYIARWSSWQGLERVFAIRVAGTAGVLLLLGAIYALRWFGLVCWMMVVGSPYEFQETSTFAFHSLQLFTSKGE